MDVLAGRQKTGTVSGTLAVRSKGEQSSFQALQGNHDRAFFQSRTAYVMQGIPGKLVGWSSVRLTVVDDAFLPELTVMETLQYSYDLKVWKTTLR